MDKTKEFKQLLLCGLDGSGKTTLIKQYSQDLNQYAAKQAALPILKKNDDNENENPNKNTICYTSTPFISMEKVFLPESSMPCVVYDVSG